ncbi:MAG: hypothetical protein ACLFR0_08245 [Alphaproteobacteria bacterium]
MQIKSKNLLAECFRLQADMIDMVSDSLLAVPKAIAEQADPGLIAQAQLSFMRHTTNGAMAVFAQCAPEEFTTKDLKYLSDHCDNREKKANRRVKNIVIKALESIQEGRPTHLFDIGCGQHPLINHMNDSTNVAFTGIDILRKEMLVCPEKRDAITNENLLPISWKEAYRNPQVKDGHTPVCTAVYSLHFFNKDRFPDELTRIIDYEGFFVGNLYLMGTRRERQASLDTMRASLEKADMDYAYIMDGTHNSFFIISDPDNGDMIDKGMDSIEQELAYNPR